MVRPNKEQCRRASDTNGRLTQLKYQLLDGDIGMLLILGGLGLILWALFGMFMFVDDLAAYTKMFPFGNGWFWVTNYILCGIAMIFLAARRLPALPSLLIGSWVCVIWTWASLARMTVVATYQTGNATSIVYILVGLLIIHRSARR
jgi:hypothetical protein